MNDGIFLKNVGFSYPDGSVALKNINFNVKKGAFIGITGLNGSGKTTLLYLLNGLIPHFIAGRLEGEIAIDGEKTADKSVSYFAKKIGMLFQNPDFSLFNLSVKEEIIFGLKNLNLNNHSFRIKQALSAVNLENYTERDPQTLSYGEKQKVNLACILAIDPQYLVLDEPSAMLDYKSAKHLYDMLKKLNDQGKTIVVVEHDTDLLNEYSKEMIIMNKSEIVALGSAKTVFANRTLLNKIGIKNPK